jgi:chaperone BCS1
MIHDKMVIISHSLIILSLIYIMYVGKPGCGKTSLVTALAGELKLPIYMLSLATPGLSDSSLLDLLNQTPPHMILLLEDIDAVFDVALKNDEKNRKAKAKAASQEDEEEVDEGRREAVGFGARGPQRTFVSKRQMVGKINISFAGILNAVDGVAAQTGRLLFMTTNHKEKLDTALIRPGRIDYQVQFREANREQIKALFFNFYKPLEHASDEEEIETAKQKLHRLEARVKEEQNLALLGEQFAARVPEGKYTMAQVQGVFMRHRRDPKEMLACLADELDLMDEGEPNEVPSLSRQLSGKKVDL